MSLLSDFEDRVGRTVEGGFARMFRSPVQPAEIAKAAGKEADRRRKVGPGKVWAPTLYNVLLSPQDDENIGGFIDTLGGELETYLVGYAREKNYSLATRPVVRFIVDPKLKLGRFNVIGELLSPDELEAELGPDLFSAVEDDEYYNPDAEQPELPKQPKRPAADSRGDAEWAPAPVTPPVPVATPAVPMPSIPEVTPRVSMPIIPEVTPRPRPAERPLPRTSGIFDAEADGFDVIGEPVAAPSSRTPGIATVTVSGIEHDVALHGDRMVVGRVATCDICLADKNTSRQHAAFIREGLGWSVEDLGSTNGTVVNGATIDHVRLREGDVVVVGITELVYHEPRG